MSDYSKIYSLRLNRYGEDHTSRVQGARERNFEVYLEKTTCRVDFEVEGEMHPGSLERYKQDATETLHYLLTKRNLDLPQGLIIDFQSPHWDTPWMVMYKEHIAASGYNRYVMLRMTHYITWEVEGGGSKSSWAYLFGPGSSAIKAAVMNKQDGIYMENNNLFQFVMPHTDTLKRNTYLEVGETTKESFVVTGVDRLSTPGVVYVSIDPVPIKDTTPAPTPEEGDGGDEYFWLKGGNS